MALTESNPFSKGTKAPGFELLNTIDNTLYALRENTGSKGTVIMFICNHCPFVIHVNEQLVRLANDYQKKGFTFVAISSNDIVNYPQDAPNKMKELAEDLSYPFPYLHDETQEVAKAYDAACTPDFYVFNADLKSVYHGQLDNSRPGNGIPVTGESIRNVLDYLDQEKEVDMEGKASIGCGIKWK